MITYNMISYHKYIIWYHLYVESKNRYKLTYLENRKRLTDIENKLMVTTQERWRRSIWSLGFSYTILYIKRIGTSLVAQWLRICLPMQGTLVRSLVQEDPTCCGATKPVYHNYWDRVPQLLKPACLEPGLRNKRSHCNEKPKNHNEE